LSPNETWSVVGRVVLVDHRDDPPVEQLAQRAPRVDVVRAGAHVEEREQHLGGGQPAVAQQLVVDAVELALADRAGRLQVLDRPRADRQLEQPHPARDRARGDDHHVDALAVQRGDLVADAVEHAGAQVAVRLGDDGGSELDDEGGHGAESQVRSSPGPCERALALLGMLERRSRLPSRRSLPPRRRPPTTDAEGARDPARRRHLARALPGRAEHRAAPAPGSVQPVGGFSALLKGPLGSYLAMPDNGFGSKRNSHSFLLRVYAVEGLAPRRRPRPRRDHLRDPTT
jgi:hypothetical protein